jgi:ATP-binding cassette subfamily F protein 3
MLEWQENWINNFSGAALIVSHDRTFLDRTVHRILDLDPETHAIREYKGNYSDYIIQFMSDREKQMNAYRDQEYEIQRMKQDIARTKQQASWVEQTTTSREPGKRRIAKKVAKKAKSRERKLERYQGSDQRIEKPMQSWQMKLEFDQPTHQSQIALSMDGLSIGYPGYDPLVRNLSLTIQAGERIVLTGENGGGKTTLLRTIAGIINPLEGNLRLGPSVRLGYMTQEQESLPLDLNAVEIVQQNSSLNETEVRSFLHFFLFSGDDPLRLIGALSYGERSRLSLALLVARGSNMLVLDEPINHLDIPSREQFEQALSQFNGTILAVVHDRYFIERFATRVWVLEDTKIISSSQQYKYLGYHKLMHRPTLPLLVKVLITKKILQSDCDQSIAAIEGYQVYQAQDDYLP